MNGNWRPTEKQVSMLLRSFPQNTRLLRSHLSNVSSSLIHGCAQMVFPSECSLCSTPTVPGTKICRTCTQELILTKRCCLRCGMPVPEVLPNEDCIRCREQAFRFGRVIALGLYEGPLQKAAIACKQRPYENLRQALAMHLHERVMERIPDIEQHRPALLPVPYHWSRAFTRTAPAAVSLARSLSRLTGWPVTSGIVRRIRRTHKQGMLSLTERRENVRGAFVALDSKSLSGRHVLIVDDVLTSGATINEVARQLSCCRTESISALVVARATGW